MRSDTLGKKSPRAEHVRGGKKKGGGLGKFLIIQLWKGSEKKKKGKDFREPPPRKKVKQKGKKKKGRAGGRG